MRSQEGSKFFSLQNFLAILWGLFALYIGATVLYFILSKEFFVGKDRFDPTAYVILILGLVLVYSLSGWIVVIKAQIKAWALACLPALFPCVVLALSKPNVPPESFIDWLALPLMMGFFTQIKFTYVAIALVFFALLGGIAAKHLRLQWQ